MQNGFQVRETDAAVDNKTLNLVEHRCVCLVRITTIDTPRRDDAYGRTLVHHGANLHGRGVRTQQLSSWEIERIVHGPRRMAFRNIQRGEVVILILDLGPRAHAEARVPEDRFDAGHGERYGVSSANRIAATRQRHVDGILCQSFLQRG